MESPFARKLTILLLALAAGLCAGLFLVYRNELPGLPRIFLKVFPILMLVIWRLNRPLTAKNWPFLVAIILVFFADIAMDISRVEIFFLGIGLNILVLIFYIVAFFQVTGKPCLPRLLPFLVLIVPVYFLLLPQLGIFALPIGIYALLYIIFLWRAGAQVGSPGTKVRFTLLSFAGALSVAVSDMLLGLQLFHPVEGWLTSYPFSMVLWWAGQALLIFTAGPTTKSEPAPSP